MDTRKAQLGREWEAHTPAHEGELRRATESFDQFEQGNAVDPLAIVGAFRSGKTQLMYHLFDDAWDRGIPAFYIGDPGAMLEKFEASGESELDTWIESRIDAQLEAYAAGDVDGVDWFPNVSSADKEEFVTSVGFESATELAQTALFFDEVEQSYSDFMRVMDQDDANPLRKINDSLQDSIKVWSFGMISAFEFIGEADWGRMKEIRIPPLSVGEVRGILESKRPEASNLANTLWWLARGRTGLIIKLVEELPGNIADSASAWLQELSEADFKDTRLIDNIWTDLPREQWEAATGALLFQDDGLDSWMEREDTAIRRDTCRNLTVDIIAEEGEFSETELGGDASELVDRNITRVFEGLSAGEDQLFPPYAISNETQGNAVLDLVSNMIVSFEPANRERSRALETIDSLEDKFHTEWLQAVTREETLDRKVAIPKPNKVCDAFPPIAVNPDRVSDRKRSELRDEMERGLNLTLSDTANQRVSIRVCPDKQTAENEGSELVRKGDITEPTLLVIPEETEWEPSPGIRTLSRHSLVEIHRHQSSRFWSFVCNLYGRLDDTPGFDRYQTSSEIKRKLVEGIEEREVRNTIETLHDQLEQLTTDAVQPFRKEYETQYSLADSKRLIWEEERLRSSTPFWSNGQFSDDVVAMSYLLVFGPEYETGREHSKLNDYIETGIQESLVRGGQAGFGYKSYFDDVFKQNGYAQSVEDERQHYMNNGQIDPGLQQLQDALTALAYLTHTREETDPFDETLSNLGGSPDIASQVGDPQLSATNGEIQALDFDDGLYEQAYPLLRALLIRGLVTGSDPKIDTVAKLKELSSEFETLGEKIDRQYEQITNIDSQLKPPDVVSVGSWVDVEGYNLKQFETNITQIKQGIGDLIDRCTTESEWTTIGYHYWFFLHQYRPNINDKVDTLASELGNLPSDNINDAKILFEETYNTAQESEAVELHFESRQNLLSSLEAYGDSLFDISGRLGAETLSLPENKDELTRVNDEFRGQIPELRALKSDMDQIDRQSPEVQEKFERTRTQMRELLTAPEVTSNE